MTERGKLSQWTDKLQEQATPRARIGLGLLIAILAIWGLGELSASTSALRGDVEELHRARRLELSLLSDQSWIMQAETLQDQLSQTQSDFWRGATNGIVAAQLQGAVETAARNAELTGSRVNVQATPEPLGDTASLFEISLSGRDSEGQFLALFQELSRLDHQVVITQFNWRRSNGSLDLRLQAPALVTSSTEVTP